MIKPYPKIWAIGNPDIERLFLGPVEVTEKLDGSQFAFGVLDNGELEMRSKGAMLYPESKEKIFRPAIDSVLALYDLKNLKEYKGWWFYGETLAKPRHNTLNYDRVPKGHVALFGAIQPSGEFISWEGLERLAKEFEIEVVPLIYYGEIKNTSVFKDYLTKESCLGGETIEGVVVKNYKESSKNFYSPQCFGKFVREDFKERNDSNWKKEKSKSKLADFFNSFQTKARWQKAVQHLRERGELEQSPRDIGKLIVEVQKDIELEEQSFIKEQLYNLNIKPLLRCSTNGLAEWWKQTLLDRAFEKTNEKPGI